MIEIFHETVRCLSHHENTDPELIPQRIWHNQKEFYTLKELEKIAPSGLTGIALSCLSSTDDSGLQSPYNRDQRHRYAPSWEFSSFPSFVFSVIMTS